MADDHDVPHEDESSAPPPESEVSVGVEETARDSESPHEAMLHNSRGGPYYLAPDSADPPPSGMWAMLDTTAVEAEVARVNADLDAGMYSMNKPPSALRKRLESGGPAARNLLASLERRARPSATPADVERTPQ